MADLRLQRRIEDGDREALEHIARALEDRVILGPGLTGPLPQDNEAADATPVRESNGASHEEADDKAPAAGLPPLEPGAAAALLEAMPAAIGVLHDGHLIHLNTAFAYAFGYRAPAELLEAGGLKAILPAGATLTADGSSGQTGELEALTRSRRRVPVVFALSALDAAAGTQLLRLIDPLDLEAEPAEPPASSAPAEEEAQTDVPPAAAEDESSVDVPPSDEALPEVPASEAAGPAKPALVPSPPVSPRDEAALWGAPEPGANEGRLDFLAKVSHEVRTPLNSIIGFAEMMVQERFGPLGNARYRGYAEDIHDSGLYALSLLNDLLDISKIEAGKFELDFTAVDVAEIVEMCVASLQPLAKRTRVVLRTSMANDLPCVIADPRRLKQILLNLLTNAIKFTPEGGQIFVSGTMVKGELRLRVRDSGVGMSENEIAFAMEPFHQLDTAPRRQSGTGLGLPLTKALADANRATLELRSEPGVGTSADVIFPAERLYRP